MAGGALLPSYYNSKVKLAILLAPVASIMNNHNPGMVWMSMNRIYFEKTMTKSGKKEFMSYKKSDIYPTYYFCLYFGGVLCNIN